MFQFWIKKEFSSLLKALAVVLLDQIWELFLLEGMDSLNSVWTAVLCTNQWPLKDRLVLRRRKMLKKHEQYKMFANTDMQKDVVSNIKYIYETIEKTELFFSRPSSFVELVQKCRLSFVRVYWIDPIGLTELMAVFELKRWVERGFAKKLHFA